MDPEISLPHSQEPTTCPNLSQSNPVHISSSHILKTHFNIILLSMPGLRVFENRVLRRVCGPKRDELTGEWRKLHKEELSDLY